MDVPSEGRTLVTSDSKVIKQHPGFVYITKEMTLGILKKLHGSEENTAMLELLCQSYMQLQVLGSKDHPTTLIIFLQKELPIQEYSTLMLELLYRIHRYDVLKVIGSCHHQVKLLLQTEDSLIDPVWRFAYELVDSLDADEATSIIAKLDGKSNTDSICRSSYVALAQLIVNLRSQKRLKLLIEATKSMQSVVDIVSKLELYLDEPDHSHDPVEASEDLSFVYEPDHSQDPLEDLSPEDCSAEEEIASLHSDLDSLPFYPMRNSPSGLCIIFNIQTFKDPETKDRDGSEIDCKNLKECFQQFDFIVDDCHNSTKSDVMDKLHQVAGADHSHHDCVVVWILSHGKEGMITASDMEDIPIHDIRSAFNHTETLVGKPKLFFIQACRGDIPMTGGPKSPYVEDDGPKQKPGEEPPPEFADQVIFHATVARYKSFREKTRGSWFVNTFVMIMKKYGHEEISTIVTRVNNVISTRTGKLDGNYSYVKQASEYTTTLLKGFKFRRRSPKQS